MATSKEQVTATYEAAADLSAKQYFNVTMDSDGKVAACTSIADIPIGILQNTPVTSDAARVALSGISKIHLGETVDEGAIVSTSATGMAVAAASTSYPLGLITKGGAINEYGTINLNISYTVIA